MAPRRLGIFRARQTVSTQEFQGNRLAISCGLELALQPFRGRTIFNVGRSAIRFEKSSRVFGYAWRRLRARVRRLLKLGHARIGDGHSSLRLSLRTRRERRANQFRELAHEENIDDEDGEHTHENERYERIISVYRRSQAQRPAD